MNALEIVDTFVTRNEEKEITSLDFAGFDGLVDELVAKRIELRKVAVKLGQETKKADNEAKAVAGKNYFDSLPVGALFTYTDASGQTIELKKIETKSKSGLTAAGEMTNPPAGAKSTKRYPKFYQLNVA